MKFKPRDIPAKTLPVDRRERGKSAVGCGISEVSIIAPRDEPSASQTPTNRDFVCSGLAEALKSHRQPIRPTSESSAGR